MKARRIGKRILRSGLVVALAGALVAACVFPFEQSDEDTEAAAEERKQDREEEVAQKDEETKNDPNYSTFIEENYVDPNTVEITFPQQKRNLIYIYLESMETAYADQTSGGVFDENNIPYLTQLAMNNEDFSGDSDTLNGAISLPETGWTAAGMFATTSGLPLKTGYGTNTMSTQKYFFRDVTTLGDILEDAGYRQALCIGSAASYGGRQKLFSQHGNYEMYDYDYANENGLIPYNYYRWWGFEDEKLFDIAKDLLLEMAEGDQPFNFTMLTADTHFEDGYVCDLCDGVDDEMIGDTPIEEVDQAYGELIHGKTQDQLKEQYKTVIRCSDRQVESFVEWICQQSFYENTTIVITGDHPTMDSDFLEDAETTYQEKVYTTIINGAAQRTNQMERQYSTYDIFPTTLAALGVSIEGNRLGLGTNLYSDELTLTEVYGLDQETAELRKSSTWMEAMADIDLNHNLQTLLDNGLNVASRVGTDVALYDPETNCFNADVCGIKNMPERIYQVKCRVYKVGKKNWDGTTEPNSEGIKTFTATCLGQRQYRAKIDLNQFKEPVGEYVIEYYAYTKSGEEFYGGSTTATVTEEMAKKTEETDQEEEW